MYDFSERTSNIERKQPGSQLDRNFVNEIDERTTLTIICFVSIVVEAMIVFIILHDSYCWVSPCQNLLPLNIEILVVIMLVPHRFRITLDAC